ncbi:MAG TPA: hypothetical protein VGO57_09535 [Verrucomicrobiae bacterium]|jgi:hypothetical protein
MKFTPNLNNGRNIFVFGSNEAGNHAAGAAHQAKVHWSAVQGVGFGPTGKSFAIPTMDWNLISLPLSEIQHYVDRFIAYARLHDELKFLVTPIGTGICGYDHEQIAPMFKDAPDNCVLPEEWKQ